MYLFCIVCLNVLMIIDINLICMRCPLCISENSFNFALSPLNIVFYEISYLMSHKIRLYALSLQHEWEFSYFYTLLVVHSINECSDDISHKISLSELFLQYEWEYYFCFEHLSMNESSYGFSRKTRLQLHQLHHMVSITKLGFMLCLRSIIENFLSFPLSPVIMVWTKF